MRKMKRASISRRMPERERQLFINKRLIFIAIGVVIVSAILILLFKSSPPQIISASVYPLKIMPGQVMIVTVQAKDTLGIKSAVAIFDNEKMPDERNMPIITGTRRNGVYETRWIAHDTKNQAWYNTTIIFTDILGKKTQQSIEWQDPTESHTADKIMPGTFGAGDYTFPGNLNVTGGAGGITATGGTITISNGYKIHTFTSNGTFTVTAGSGNLEVLVVAGGGGGARYLGGGGAGGVISNSSYSITAGSYSVTVGNGGAAQTTDYTAGNSGGNSVFGTLTAIGGGGGGVAAGLNGGSGGGGGDAYAGGSGTSGQGYAGGTGGHSPTYGQGGGGGGAGAVGADFSGVDGGNGGVGVSNSINGSAVYYGGGGGGGSDIRGGGGGGAGGNGGGGAGSVGAGGGAAGTANTGGGGGGGGINNIPALTDGGAGGSGIVIIRYPLATIYVAGDVQVNGTSLPKYSDSRFKVGTFTRDTTLASGTQSITGVGFKPKAVIFLGHQDGADEASWGMDDGTTAYAIGDNSGNVADTYSYTSNSMMDIEGAGTQYRGKINSWDVDGFTISWTKIGSPSGTWDVMYIAYR